VHSRVQKFGVVPAKAGTHNHKKQLLRQAGAANVPDTTACGYGSRISAR